MIDLMSPVLRTLGKREIEVTYIFDDEPDPPKTKKFVVRQLEDGRYEAAQFIDDWYPVKLVEGCKRGKEKFTMTVNCSSKPLRDMFKF